MRDYVTELRSKDNKIYTRVIGGKVKERYGIYMCWFNNMDANVVVTALAWAVMQSKVPSRDMFRNP